MLQAQEVRSSRDVRIWKTLTLGMYKSAPAYLSALRRSRRTIGPRAEYILGMPAFTCAQQEREVDLEVRSVNVLCGRNLVRYSDICARARADGLELCPAEVGVALSFAYDNQRRGDWLIIAMNPIIDFDEAPSLFVVSNVRSGGLRLTAICANSEYLWNPDDRLVFVRPR